jgi:hypothetical protein
VEFRLQFESVTHRGRICNTQASAGVLRKPDAEPNQGAGQSFGERGEDQGQAEEYECRKASELIGTDRPSSANRREACYADKLLTPTSRMHRSNLWPASYS